MKIIRNLPFAHKLFLGFVVVALVPMIITNALTVGVLNETLRRQADENARSQLGEMGRRLEDLFARSAETCAAICGDEGVSLSLIDGSGYLTTDVYQALYRASNALHAGADLSLYDAGGLRRFSTNSSLAPGTLPVSQGALRKAGERGGTVYYSPAEDSPYRLYAVQGLDHDAARVGYTVVGMGNEVFASFLATSEGSAAILLDSLGRPVYTTRTVAEGEAAALRGWLSGPATGGLVYEGQHYYAARSRASGFYLVLRQPPPLTGNTLRALQGIALLAAALSLALSLVVSASLSSGISKPVNRREREMEDTQIRLLQAQLNPHFLYNTLDTIKWTAKINGIPDIANIASSLAVILRQCVSGSQFVTLRQELDMVQGYTDIQRIRFSGKFEYLVDLPPALEGCIIPKLILQPVVENAILHGLREKESGYVYLYAAAPDEETLVISVTDDGCGMPCEIVARLNEADSKIVEGHLGLYNVNHIIKMHYGKEYGLKANSMAGVGTTVTVVLPLKRGENDV